MEFVERREEVVRAESNVTVTLELRGRGVAVRSRRRRSGGDIGIDIHNHRDASVLSFVFVVDPSKLWTRDSGSGTTESMHPKRRHTCQRPTRRAQGQHVARGRCRQATASRPEEQLSPGGEKTDLFARWMRWRSGV